MKQENKVIEWVFSICKLKSMYAIITSEGDFDFDTGMKSDLCLKKDGDNWFWEGRYGYKEPLESEWFEEFVEELRRQIKNCIHGRDFYSGNVSWIFI